MKSLKATDLTQMSVEELTAKLAEVEEEQFRIRFRTATESIENPMRFRDLRRDIARLHTILREKANG